MIKARKNSLKIIRLKAGLLQREVAKGIGISENSYSIIERGTRSVGGKTARAICNLLSITFDEAFEITEPVEKYRPRKDGKL